MTIKVITGKQTSTLRLTNNEKDIVKKFNNWKTDEDAQLWLNIMNYKIDEIETIKAVITLGYQTDVQVQITIYLKEAIDVQNIQVKLVKE